MNKSVPNFRLYGDPDTDLSCEPVHVDDVAISKRQHNWYVEPHRHDDLYQFVFYRKGHGRLKLEDQEQAFETPIFMLVPPTSVHSFEMSRELEGEIITMPADYLNKLMSPSPGVIDMLSQPLLYQDHADDDFLQQISLLFEQIKTEYNERQLGRNLTLQGLVGILIGKLLRYQDHSHRAERRWGVENPSQWYYRQFHNQIGQNLWKKTTIADHAARLRISSTHLNRVCREVAGKSALDVIHDRMIQEAKRSLAYTVMPIADIGDQLGFSDPSYFSRFFKSKTGLSPKAYQSQIRREI